MAWIYLLAAAIFEICWAAGLKFTDGFTKPIPTALTLICYLISFILLGIAVKNLPLGTAYAIWTGIGTLGIAVFGIMILDEPASLIRIGCMLVIVLGIIGLKLSSGY